MYVFICAFQDYIFLMVFSNWLYWSFFAVIFAVWLIVAGFELNLLPYARF